MNDRKVYKDYTELAFKRRGLILNEVALLERLIDLYLAYHFCGVTQKAMDLMNCILSTRYLTFEGKVQILKFINPNLLDEHPISFKNILEKIIPQRNIFAHYTLYTPNRKPGRQTDSHFIKYNGTSEIITYTEQNINELHTLINISITVFIELTERLEAHL